MGKGLGTAAAVAAVAYTVRANAARREGMSADALKDDNIMVGAIYGGIVPAFLQLIWFDKAFDPNAQVLLVAFIGFLIATSALAFVVSALFNGLIKPLGISVFVPPFIVWMVDPFFSETNLASVAYWLLLGLFFVYGVANAVIYWNRPIFAPLYNDESLPATGPTARVQPSKGEYQAPLPKQKYKAPPFGGR